MKHHLHEFLVVFLLWFTPGLNAGQFLFDTVDEAQPPQDLLLSDDQRRESEALGSFAWGLFLQLMPVGAGDDASAAFIQALRHHPDSSVYLGHVAEPHFQSGSFEELAAILLPLAQANPTIVDLQLATSLALRRCDRPGEALDLIARAYSQIEPPNPRLFREYAALLWRNDDFQGVRELLKSGGRSKTLRDGYVMAFSRMSFHQSTASERVTEALALSRRDLKREKTKALRFAKLAVQRLDPENADGVRRADIDVILPILFESEEFEHCLTLLDKAERLFPENDFVFGLDRVVTLEALDRYDQADSILNQLESDAEMHGNRLVELGLHYLNRGEPMKAQSLFKDALLADPSSMSARANLAYVLNLLGQHEQALQMLQFLSTPPIGVQMIKAQALYGTGDLDAALQTVEQIERVLAENDTPVDVDLLLFKATVLERMGLIDRAIAQAETALTIAPENAIVQNFLGYVLADADRELERAEELIEQAVAQDPDSAAFRDSLAWVHYRQGNWNEALQEMTHALRLMRRTDAHDGIIFEHAGDIFEANEFLRAALHFQARSLLDAKDQAAERIQEKIKSLQSRLELDASRPALRPAP